jgi:hypothetical protein
VSSRELTQWMAYLDFEAERSRHEAKGTHPELLKGM